METIPGERDGGVSFPGDPEQWIPKWIPVWWRLRWRWAVLSLTGDPPYRVYSKTESTRMMCRREIATPYVAVRIGPGPVTFFIVDSRGRLVPVGRLGWLDGRWPDGARDLRQEVRMRELHKAGLISRI